jgi:hypothetical protein
MHRQSRKCQEVRYADVEEGESFPLDGVRNFLDVGFQLSDAHLHDRFPERHHTDEDVVAGIFDQFPRLRAQLVIVS